MTFKEKYGNTALVAGASEGMGAAYAKALASRGLNLVLVARRQDVLQKTADEIATQYNVKVLPVVCNLAAADATQQITQAIGDTAIDFSYIMQRFPTSALTSQHLQQRIQILPL